MALKLRSSNYRGYTVTLGTSTGDDVAAGEYVKRGDVPGFYFEAYGLGKKAFVVTDADEVELKCKQEAASQGAKAYWDSTNNQVDKAASSNQLIGYFAETKTATPTVCRVVLEGSAVAVGT